MIRTLLLTTALLGGFMMAHAITDEARAQRAPADRRVTLADATSNLEVQSERRVALVVGNSHYQAEKISLANPGNDATDIAAALRKLGFDVLIAIDAGKQEFERKVAEFARMGKNADMALFFYAGHALQFQGQNYLMPVDGELKDGDSIWSMVRLDDVRRALDRFSGLKVMILDACRNNPLSDRIYRSFGGEGNQRGLARIGKTQGMIVAYATAADEVAEDGKGRNSPFTGALLNRIDEAGLEITKMLRLVGADVSAQTGDRQRPEISVQSYNDYFLNQSDRVAWEKIRNPGDVSELRDFIKRFPWSPYYPVVLDRLEREEARARQQAAEEAERKRAEQQAAEAERQRLESEATARHEAEERARQQAADEAERQRAEQQAALQRQEDDRRAKAAEAERHWLEREATARREAEERARQQAAAEAERQRAEQQAASQRQEDDRAKAAEAERQRLEREAKAKREAEERARQQAADEAERQRAEQQAALQRQEDDRRAKAAEAERHWLEREATARREAEERARQQAAAEAERQRAEQRDRLRHKEDDRRIKAAKAERLRLEREAAARRDPEMHVRQQAAADAERRHSNHQVTAIRETKPVEKSNQNGTKAMMMGQAY